MILHDLPDEPRKAGRMCAPSAGRSRGSQRHLWPASFCPGGSRERAASGCLIRSSNSENRMVDFDDDRQWEDNIMVAQPGRIDQFLVMHSARLDNWREITALAEAWQVGSIE